MKLENIIALMEDNSQYGAGSFDVPALINVEKITAILNSYDDKGILIGSCVHMGLDETLCTRETPMEIVQKIYELKNNSIAYGLTSENQLERQLAEFKRKIELDEARSQNK